jgi:hypothetical protein
MEIILTKEEYDNLCADHDKIYEQAKAEIYEQVKADIPGNISKSGQTWHKAVDGDLPTIFQTVLIAVRRITNDGDEYIFTTIGRNEPYTTDTVTWNIQGLCGQCFGDEIIAWMELPEYKK